jgi:hypothetical protein
MMKKYFFHSALLLSVFAVSCSPYVEPSAAGKPITKVATILGQQAPLLDMNGTVGIRSVDGTDIKNFVTSQYTLSPGNRKLRVFLDHPEYRGDNQFLMAKLAAGRTYIMRSNITSAVVSSPFGSTQGLIWKPTVEDKSTGQVVSKEAF